ncbi:hypothetical protein [Streptomyces oceani]|uniref:hypothetical protein n=1 Tax=Streptomyces oceani TaxID=1075402 RepID=UPI0009A111D4|nr:hypothetical protein [Streptomyces oceani]
MNTRGTITCPLTRDPSLRQFPEQDPTMRTARTGTAPRGRTEATLSPQIRNRQMQLMPESLTRAHMESRLHEAESERRALRVVTAHRLQRRAERASQRARRALAMAVMQ